ITCLLCQGGSGDMGLGAHDREIYLGVRVVRGKLNASQRNQARARDVDLALNEAGQILLDLVGQAGVTVGAWLGLVSTHNELKGTGDLFDLEEFELVTDFDVVVAFERDPAIEARFDLLNVVLESTQ